MDGSQEIDVHCSNSVSITLQRERIHETKTPDHQDRRRKKQLEDSVPRTWYGSRKPNVSSYWCINLRYFFDRLALILIARERPPLQPKKKKRGRQIPGNCRMSRLSELGAVIELFCSAKTRHALPGFRCGLCTARAGSGQDEPDPTHVTQDMLRLALLTWRYATVLFGFSIQEAAANVNHIVYQS